MALSLALFGCGPQYVYTPPTTTEGRACVAQCQTTQASCRVYQDRQGSAEAERCRQEASYQFGQCQHDLEVQYTACLRFARSDADQASCDKDHKKHACFEQICPSGTGQYGVCDQDYRGCFQNCGGQVGVVQQ